MYHTLESAEKTRYPRGPSQKFVDQAGYRGDEEVLLEENWSCFMTDLFAGNKYSGRVLWVSPVVTHPGPVSSGLVEGKEFDVYHAS